MGFIPVTNLKKALVALEPLTGKAKDVGKGVFEFSVGEEQSVFVTEKGGWAWIAQSMEHLAGAPKDPVKALGGLNESYEWAVRVNINNIPALFRPMLLAPLQLGAQMGAARAKGESPQAFALRTKYLNWMTQQLMVALNDLETILVGVHVDDQAPAAIIDYQVTALPGTKTARQMAEAKDAKSRFAAFVSPDAAFCAGGTGKLSETDIAQAKRMIEGYRSTVLKGLDDFDMPEAELKVAKQMIEDVMDVLEKTTASGQTDHGLTVLAGAKRLCLVGGTYLADTAKLDSVLKRLLPYLRKENPELADAVKLDAETHEGVKMHTLSLPADALGEAGQRLAPLLGEKLDVVLGIGPQAAFLAVGRDALSALKQLIDQSKPWDGKPVAPFRLSVAATPILQAVNATAQRDEVKQQAAESLKALGQLPAGRDHVTMTSQPIANGVRVHVVLEAGILKILSSGAKAAVE